MTDEQGPTESPALTHVQRDRLGYARQDLEAAQGADLPQLDQAGLILLIARLCTRLDDILSLVDELSRTDPPD